MGVVLKEADEWKEIPVDGGSFEVRIRRPTYKELIDDLRPSDDPLSERRIFRSICDWRGVQDANGDEIPFSWESMEKLIGQFPMILSDLLDVVSELYFGTTGEREKN